VVAAVYATPDDAKRLREAGVRDSKTVDPGTLRRMSGEILNVIPETHRRVRVLMPEEYNRLYASKKNLNLLLAQIYAETARDVWKAVPTDTIFCDQFAKREELLEGFFRTFKLPVPRQQTKAESASIAVASASVLATAAFADAMERLGDQAGLGKPLPKGASDLRALKAAARHLLQQEGPEGLGRYAKLHFKPVQEVLSATGK
ncbi:MAG: hypothetical protein KY468_13455, partial [Armatimonadetes bacterium]|nr:hypothetical protein [Armatimonadota bacterium]